MCAVCVDFSYDPPPSFVENTEIEGGQVAPAIDVLCAALHDVVDAVAGAAPAHSLLHHVTALPTLPAATLTRITHVLRRTAEVDARVNALRRSGDEEAFVAFIGDMRQALLDLSLGESACWVGGWRRDDGGHALSHVIRRTSDTTVTFSVCNSGDGLNYHPVAMEYPKTKYRTCIQFTDVALDRLADDGALLMLFRQQVCVQKPFNRMEVLYDVLLPHITNTALLADAVDACPQPPFKTPQRSGSCHTKAITAAIGYMLWAEGLPQATIKAVSLAMKLAMASRMVADAASAPPASVAAFEVNTVGVACRQLARLAIKAHGAGRLADTGLPAVLEALQGCQRDLQAARQPDADSSATSATLPALPLSSVAVQPVSGFHLLEGVCDAEAFAGPHRTTVGQHAVDLTLPSTPCTLNAIAAALKAALRLCDTLKARSSATVGNARVVATVSGVMLRQVPIPLPRPGGVPNPEDPWVVYTDAWLTLRAQHQILSCLMGLHLHFAAAVKSLPFEHVTEGANIATSAAILAGIDTAARLHCVDGVSPVRLQTLPPAVPHPRPPPPQLASLLHDGTPPPPPSPTTTTGFPAGAPRFRISTSSFAGYSVTDRLSMCLAPSPAVVAARHRLHAYTAAYGETPPVFHLPDGAFKFDRESPLFEFVAALLDALPPPQPNVPADVFDAVVDQPAGTGHLTSPEEVSPAERLGMWLVSSWEACPAMGIVRDAATLHMVLMEDFRSSFCVPLRPWQTSHAKPKWKYTAQRSSLERAALDVDVFGALLDAGYAIYWQAPAPKSAASPGVVVGEGPVDPAVAAGLIPASDVSLTEAAIMAMPAPDTWDGAVTPDDARALASYLTAPYVRMPLVLRWAAKESSLSALHLPAVRAVLRAVLFEPLEYAAEAPPPGAEWEAPLPPAPRWVGTPYGALANELCTAPTAVTGPLLTLARNVEGLCAGPYAAVHQFVDVLCFVAQLLVDVRAYCGLAAGVGGAPPGLDAAVRDVDGYVTGSLRDTLRRHAEGVGDDNLPAACKLRAHLAITFATLPDAASAAEFLAAACFVVTYAKEYTSNTPGSVTVLFHELNREEDGSPLPVPLHRVLDALAAHGDALAGFASAGGGPQVDALLSGALAAALRQPRLAKSTGWVPATKASLCHHVVESEHPYGGGGRAPCSLFEVVSFPGAPYIQLVWSQESYTHRDDVVVVYKDASCTESWGKFYGHRWPGCWGMPPLVVPADHCVVHFHSDAPPPSLYGFRVTAQAPVNEAAVEAVAASVAEGAGADIVYACRKLVAMFQNQEAKAVAFVRDMSLHDLGALAAAGLNVDDVVPGLWTHSSGTYQLNVRGAEVMTQGRLLVPTPTPILRHPAFEEVFEGEPPALCMMVSSTTSRTHVRLETSSGEEVEGALAFDVVWWEPQAASVVAPSPDAASRAAAFQAATASTAQGVVSPAGTDGCFRIPVGDGTSVSFLGRVLDVVYTPGSLGWLSDALDRLPLFAAATTWYAGGEPDSVDTLVSWCPTGGDNLAPGWYEVAAANGVARVYYLQEVGRRAQRLPVYCSDGRFDIAGLHARLSQKQDPRPETVAHDTRFSGDSPYSGGSLVITRTRWQLPPAMKASLLDDMDSVASFDSDGPGADALTAVETHVPAAIMAGALPQALVEGHTWWRVEGGVGGTQFRGDPLGDAPHAWIDVHMVGGGCGLVTRHAAGTTETLLNLHQAPRGAPLHSIARWAARLDNLSHVMAWSGARAATPGDSVGLARVEFPRLGLRFVAGAGGVLRCVEHPGLSTTDGLTPDTAAALATTPFGVALTDGNDTTVLCGNQPVHAPVIRGQPFTCALRRCVTRTWLASAPQRYFLYAVRGPSLTGATLSATLYAVQLSLLRGDYVAAAAHIEFVYMGGGALTVDESYFLAGVLEAEDSHPDAHACRLKLLAKLAMSLPKLSPPPPTQDIVVDKRDARGIMEMKFGEGKRDAAVAARVIPNETLLAMGELSSHFRSYLAKLPAVSAACRLAVDEEVVLLTLLARRASNRGLHAALEARLAVVGGGATHRTLTLESQHPHGAFQRAVRVVFPGAASLRLAFDESSEMMGASDGVCVYTDATLGTAATPLYSGSVFKGNWAGSRPNPFKPARPDGVVAGDTAVVYMHAAAPSSDWGFKLSVTAEMPPGCVPTAQELDMEFGGSPLHPVALSESKAGGEGGEVGGEGETGVGIPVRRPPRSPGGAPLQFVRRVAGDALTRCCPLPWPRTVKYLRRADTVTGPAALKLVSSFLSDDVLGESRKLGWLLLYDILRGDMVVDVTGNGPAPSVAVLLFRLAACQYNFWGERTRAFGFGLQPFLVLSAMCDARQRASTLESMPPIPSPESLLTLRMDSGAGAAWFAEVVAAARGLAAVLPPAGLPPGPVMDVAIPPLPQTAASAGADTSCSQRVLPSQEPLLPADVTACVGVSTGVPPPTQLPFDVGGHPAAGHPTGAAKLAYLRADMKAAPTPSTPHLHALPPHAMHALCNADSVGAAGEVLEPCLAALDGLLHSLRAASRAEGDTLRATLDRVLAAASGDDNVHVNLHHVAQASRRPTFNDLAAFLLSSTPTARLQTFNPTADDTLTDAVLGDTALALAACVRLRHMYRCTALVDGLRRRVGGVMLEVLVGLVPPPPLAAMLADACECDVDPTLDGDVLRGMAAVALEASGNALAAACATLRSMSDAVVDFVGQCSGLVTLPGQPPAAVMAAVAMEVSAFDSGAAMSVVQGGGAAAAIDLAKRGCTYRGQALGGVRRILEAMSHTATPPPGTQPHASTSSHRPPAPHWECTGVMASATAALTTMAQAASDTAAALRATWAYMEPGAGGGLGFDPRFLVFEFLAGVVLRHRQVELVREFVASAAGGASSVRQMIMGAGKTTVIAPLLCLMLADGEALVTVAVPPALFAQSRDLLWRTYRRVVPMPVMPFEFDRSCYQHDVERVDTALAKFHGTARRRGVVLTTADALKSVLLCQLDVLKAGGDAALAARLGDILAVWRRGVLILDEVDVLLHPLRSELNFPCGPRKALDAAPARWDLPLHILQALFPRPTAQWRAASVAGDTTADVALSSAGQEVLREVAAAVAAGCDVCALQTQPHLLLLDAGYYHATLRPLLARWAMLWVARRLPGAAPTAAAVLEYVVGGAGGAAVRALPPDAVKVANLARDWLSTYLPHCLSKASRVAYGLVDDASSPRGLHAVPFVAKDMPSPSAEYANNEIVIGLTTLAFLHEGLRPSDVSRLVRHMKQNLQLELGPLRARPSSVAFQAFVGNHTMLPLEYIRPEDGLILNQLLTVVRGRHFPSLWYLRHVVFPASMAHQSSKLSASGADLGGHLFGTRLGFSGTPSDTLQHTGLRCGFEPGASAQILSILSDPRSVGHTCFHGWDVTSLLAWVATSTSPRFHALIDVGALVTGLTNGGVAAALLRFGLPGFDAVAYWDEADQAVVLGRGEGATPVPVALSGVPVERRFVFFDQGRSFGMDIALSSSAVGALTVSKDSTLRDVCQGAWRLRGLGKGQACHLVLVKEALSLVAGVDGGVTRDGADEVVVKALAWLTVNEMASERLANQAASKLALCQLWRQPAFQALARVGGPAAAPVLECLTEAVSSDLRGSVEPPPSVVDTLAEAAAAHGGALGLSGDATAAIGVRLGELREALRGGRLPDLDAEQQVLYADEEQTREADVDLDTAIVHTRESERESERETETEAEANRQGGGAAAAAVRPWRIAVLGDVHPPGVFHGVAGVQVAPGVTPLAFPHTVSVSENHTQVEAPVGTPRTLLGVHVLLVARWGATWHAVALTVGEAAAVRRALHVAHPAARACDAALVLCDSGVVLDGGELGPVGAELTCARFLRGDLWYSPQETSALLHALEGSPPADRVRWWEAMAACRPTPPGAPWAATPVAQALTQVDAAAYDGAVAALRTLFTNLASCFASLAAAFAAFDGDGDARLAPEDFAAMVGAHGDGAVHPAALLAVVLGDTSSGLGFPTFQAFHDALHVAPPSTGVPSAQASPFLEAAPPPPAPLPLALAAADSGPSRGLPPPPAPSLIRRTSSAPQSHPGRDFSTPLLPGGGTALARLHVDVVGRWAPVRGAALHLRPGGLVAMDTEVEARPLGIELEAGTWGYAAGVGGCAGWSIAGTTYVAGWDGTTLVARAGEREVGRAVVSLPPTKVLTSVNVVTGRVTWVAGDAVVAVQATPGVASPVVLCQPGAEVRVEVDCSPAAATPLSRAVLAARQQGVRTRAAQAGVKPGTLVAPWMPAGVVIAATTGGLPSVERSAVASCARIRLVTTVLAGTCVSTGGGVVGWECRLLQAGPGVIGAMAVDSMARYGSTSVDRGVWGFNGARGAIVHNGRRVNAVATPVWADGDVVAVFVGATGSIVVTLNGAVMEGGPPVAVRRALTPCVVVGRGLRVCFSGALTFPPPFEALGVEAGTPVAMLP